MSGPELAFEEALNAAEEEKGTREKVNFRSANIDVLPMEAQLDYIPVGSGMASAAPVRLSVRTSDVTLPIVQLEAITFRGRSLRVLDHSPLVGRIAITAGDPSAEGTE